MTIDNITTTLNAVRQTVGQERDCIGKQEQFDHQLLEIQVKANNAAKRAGPDKQPRSQYRRALCEQTWRDLPTSKCPGTKLYAWVPWPEGLLTRKQLAAKKLLPGPVLATYSTQGKSGYRRVPLYFVATTGLRHTYQLAA